MLPDEVIALDEPTILARIVTRYLSFVCFGLPTTNAPRVECRIALIVVTCPFGAKQRFRKICLKIFHGISDEFLAGFLICGCNGLLKQAFRDRECRVLILIVAG